MRRAFAAVSNFYARKEASCKVNKLFLSENCRVAIPNTGEFEVSTVRFL